MANTSNVSFYRGLASNLPSKDNAVDGRFYLTTDKDNEKLYVGYVNGTDKRLIEFSGGGKVPVFSSSTEATNNASSYKEGTLAFVSDSNALLIKKSSGWEQVNPDTNTVTTITGINAGTSVVKDATGGGKQLEIPFTVNQQFKNGDTVTWSNQSTTITIPNSQFSSLISETSVGVERTVDTTNKTISIKTNGSGANTTSVANIAFTGNTVSVSSQGVVTVGDNSYKYENGALKVTAGENTIGDVPLYVNVGKTPEKHALNTNLPVYTIDEVNEKIGQHNAVVYKGTVSAYNGTGGLPTIASGVKIGDTYMVSKDFSNGNDNYYVGDLLIAKGTETAQSNGEYIITTGLGWDYIGTHSNTQTDTLYTVNTGTNQLILHPSTGDAGNSVVNFVSGNMITPDVATGTANVKFNHNAVTTTRPTAVDLTANNNKVVVVSNVQTDSYGHVTAVNFGNVTLPNVTPSHSNTLTITNPTGTSTLYVANYTSTMKVGDTSATTNFTFISNTLTLAKDSNRLSMDLVWGSF